MDHKPYKRGSQEQAASGGNASQEGVAFNAIEGNSVFYPTSFEHAVVAESQSPFSPRLDDSNLGAMSFDSPFSPGGAAAEGDSDDMTPTPMEVDEGRGSPAARARLEAVTIEPRGRLPATSVLDTSVPAAVLATRRRIGRGPAPHTRPAEARRRLSALDSQESAFDRQEEVGANSEEDRNESARRLRPRNEDGER